MKVRANKRLIEDIEYYDSLLEEVQNLDGSIHPYLLINMMVADMYNANHRNYPLAEVQKALPSFIENVVKGLGSAIMLADHPEGGAQPSVKDAAGFIKEVYLDEMTKTVKGKVQLLDTLQGKNILAIVKAGGKIGVSSRGMGNLTENVINGEVFYDVKDYKLKGFDFVVFPSLETNATSKTLMYENLEQEIKDVFPTIKTDVQELKETINVIKERLQIDDIDALKADLIESVTKLISCNICESSSDVIINRTKTESLQKEDEVMTLHELKEKYPELYSEIVESTTKDVTDKVTAEVTITVTEAVTAKVTAEVTEAVALATKITLEKEFAEAQVKKESDGATSIEESQKKITGLEEEIAGLKTNVQPYVDILEGLVTYMREKGLLISEDEIISIKTELETPATEVTEEAKKLAEEMTAVINEQKAKLDEALARISALEDEKKVLEDAKAIAESEKQKAELSATITEILTKEAKYAPILKAKLESATTIEQVNQIYEQEKEFIATIEKLNASTEIPAGTGTVVEAEKIVETTIGETVLTESMTSDDKLKALKDYQRKLAGF